ncbi:hypothetical protein CYMTET_19111 [Cymbomonas tetramitiformis]|uniref:Uncharacterized protein n=1 Tax=Cymbomonas tetramitiformis TaxID=36881 RepID=A0AAE0G6U1_9CHLO|nr:hypothetical protein CYMTET_19111 [Cymbomonas tetramitiformis]
MGSTAATAVVLRRVMARDPGAVGALGGGLVGQRRRCGVPPRGGGAARQWASGPFPKGGGRGASPASQPDSAWSGGGFSTPPSFQAGPGVGMPPGLGGSVLASGPTVTPDACMAERGRAPSSHASAPAPLPPRVDASVIPGAPPGLGASVDVGVNGGRDCRALSRVADSATRSSHPRHQAWTDQRRLSRRL